MSEDNTMDQSKQGEKASSLTWANVMVALIALTVAAVYGNRTPVDNWPNAKIPCAYSAACMLLSGLLICILHARDNAKLDPLQRMVSEYALDPKHGWMMHLAFALLASGAAVLAHVFHGALVHDCIQFWLLVLASAGAVVMCLFSMKSQLNWEQKSPIAEGWMHDVGMLMSFSSVIASTAFTAIFPSRVLATNVPWLRGAALVYFTICGLSSILFVVLGFQGRKFIKPKSGKIGHLVRPGSYYAMRSEDAKGQTQRALSLQRGLGVLERILIFMFLFWGTVLSLVPWLVNQAVTVCLQHR